MVGSALDDITAALALLGAGGTPHVAVDNSVREFVTVRVDADGSRVAFAARCCTRDNAERYTAALPPSLSQTSPTRSTLQMCTPS